MSMPSAQPLRVLVTRSAQQAGQLSQKLKALRAEVIEVPVISIGPPPSWNELDATLRNCDQYDWIVFVSVNAVEYCLPRLVEVGKTIADLQQCKIAAIGPATSKSLQERGLQPDFVPSKFVAESVIAEFPGYPNLHGKKILWPRTNVGRTLIVDKLREAGAAVDMVQAYQTSEPENKEHLADHLLSLLQDRSIDAITLASSQTTVNLSKLLLLGLERAGHNPETAHSTLSELLNNVIVASIGPETSATAKRLLGKVTVQAETYTLDGLVQSLRSYLSGTERSS